MKKDGAGLSQFEAMAASYGWELTRTQLNQFEIYQRLLIEWSQRLNLTSILAPAQIQTRHFLDSLTCASVTGNLDGLTLADVGTGAGFPGLPLKILFPQLLLTLIDSTSKKTKFLDKVANELGLSEVSILAERVEEVGRQAMHREKYDWVTARGVAELRILAEYLLPLCRVNGHMLAQKGQNALAEAASAAVAIKTLGGAPPESHPVQLPDRAEMHYLIVVKKVAACPTKYPRRTGIPAKRPL